MTVFISHSFDDKPYFDNVADSLEAAGIEFWSPETILPGAPLADRLHEAIARSKLCILIATKNSVASAWCAAELGAFWGVQKRVLVFVADSSLQDSQLPVQLQGHFLERRMKKLVTAVQAFLTSDSSAVLPDQSANIPNHSNTLSREDLLQAIESALDRAHTRQLAANSLTQAAMQLQPIADEAGTPSETTLRTVRSMLAALVGLPKAEIHIAAQLSWPNTIDELATTAGSWSGYSLRCDYDVNYGGAPYCDVYICCLLVRYEANNRVAAVALTKIVATNSAGTPGIQAVHVPWSVVGRGDFGELLKAAR